MVEGYGDTNVAVALAIENKDCSIWDLVNRAAEVSEVLQTPKSAAMRKPTVATIDAKKKGDCECSGQHHSHDIGKLKLSLENEIQQLQAAFLKEIRELKRFSPSRPIRDHGNRFKSSCRHCGIVGHKARFCRVPVCEQCGKIGHTIDNWWNFPPPQSDFNSVGHERERGRVVGVKGQPDNSKDFLGVK